jgi:peptide/nickel transport system permease protein
MAIFAPALMPADPYASSILKRLKPIGFDGHLLGTDELGRDMLSRLMLGARLSLFMGITPVLLAFVIGSAIGIVAGYAGGWTNTVIMRHHRHPLRVPVGAAGHRAVRHAGRGHWQRWCR